MKRLLTIATMDNEDILRGLMLSFIAIVQSFCADYMTAYIDGMISMTAHFINTKNSEIGELAVEIWSTLC